MENKIISFDDWFDKYKPVKNHIHPEEDERFETYGEDLEFIRTQPNDKIWTLISDENGTTWVVTGMHLVNRLNYYVTEVAYENDGIEVFWGEYTGERPVREFIVRHKDEGYETVIRISKSSIELDLDDEDDEGFDSMIYYYADDEFFDTLSGEELLKHLDEEIPYTFIKEL